ncbi:hypothetical protein TIFTF001_029544 [Ficus carica]|uniref:Myb/SANT-like domain-containing protein n=2 Tax=Ficus carica TaxID=3494 RepID=A0AA88J2K5_FICCA|nr:hypothetical protein TIFTF001_029544 [Ficus carica]
MPRKALGETYIWDHAKEKQFLQQLDDYLACSGGRHPPKAILDLWATQFNAEFGGVAAHEMTLYQKKERMKKVYRGWKALQGQTGLGYDASTDRVICSDEAWQSFIQVFKECNHLRHEGQHYKELYYNVFEKSHAAGSMDNSGNHDFDEDLTPTTGARHWTNTRSGADAGPSQSRGSSGKRKQRDETDEMTFIAMQEIRWVFHPISGVKCGTTSILIHTCNSGYQYILKMNEYSSASDEEQDDVYSENEYSSHNSYLVRVVVAVTASRRNRRRQPQPMHNSTLTGSMRVEEILNGYEEIIQGLISMKSETFRSLGATNRHISYLFQHSIETTSRWFSKVLKVICSLKDNFTRPSDYTSVQNLILEHSDKYRPCVDVNADYVFHDGIDGTDPSTGTQQHDSRREAMNQMRDHIADDMWERYQTSPWYKST